MNGWGLMCIGIVFALIGMFGDPWDKGATVVFYIGLVVAAAGLIWGVSDLIINGVP